MTSNKALASTLMKKISSMKFDNSKDVCEHIMEMRHIVAYLKLLKVGISNSFLVHLMLISLQ